MTEPIATATVISAFQAGAFASLITLLLGDINILMAVFVGITGGVAFFFKEYAHLDKETKKNTTKMKIASEFMHMIPMSIATAGIVIFVGIETTNYSNFVWWFFGLLASLNYKHTVAFFAFLGKKFLNKKVDGK